MKIFDIIKESKKAETTKPRNFVAKNAINTGAGAHKDKKKAEKQGDIKHKKQTIPMDEMHGHRDAYQRDYDSSVSGFGHKDSLAYQLDGGANDEGWDKEDDYRPRRSGGFRSSRPGLQDAPHDVYIDGRKWKTFDSHSHANNVAKKLQAKGKKATVQKSLEENATAGATSAANIGTVVNPHHSPGPARGKRSYTGSVSTGSGTKSPPQPKVSQPKNSDGTAKNGLDSSNLFGAGTVKR